MRCYSNAHRFYAGVDLHARTMYVHVLDHKGQTVFEHDLPADPKAFLTAIKPYRKDLVVGVECMFAWYWLADLCAAEKIPFALGHALAMKHIHQGKAKSDRIDAGKLAANLRGGPPARHLSDRARPRRRSLLVRVARLRHDCGRVHRRTNSVAGGPAEGVRVARPGRVWRTGLRCLPEERPDGGSLVGGRPRHGVAVAGRARRRARTFPGC